MFHFLTSETSPKLLKYCLSLASSVAQLRPPTKTWDWRGSEKESGEAREERERLREGELRRDNVECDGGFFSFPMPCPALSLPLSGSPVGAPW